VAGSPPATSAAERPEESEEAAEDASARESVTASAAERERRRDVVRDTKRTGSPRNRAVVETKVVLIASSPAADETFTRSSAEISTALLVQLEDPKLPGLETCPAEQSVQAEEPCWPL